MNCTVKVVDDAYQRVDTSFFKDVDCCIGGIFVSFYRGLIGSSYSVAMDCEGVSLSREGTVELVSICFNHNPSVVYLVDLSSRSDSRLLQLRVSAVRNLCQCSTVTKVIHDCRMDSDALHHLHKINLVNVHDTSCYHEVVSGQEDANLNDTLEAYGQGSNTSRQSSVYSTNPAFWATRPLTTQMVEWASGDVSKLLRLAKLQRDRLSGRKLSDAVKKSDLRSKLILKMKMEPGLICKIDVRQFIGRGGSNIRQLQRDSGALVYGNQQAGSNAWLVYYPNKAALVKVKKAMGYECDETGWRTTTKIGTVVAGVGMVAASGGTVLVGVGVAAVGKFLTAE